MTPTVVYVRLVDDDIDVWVPAQAEQQLGDTYRIVDQPYDHETETWEFLPGESVVCSWVVLEGRRVLAAVAPSLDKQQGQSESGL